ncbi:MAG TPA: histidine kinase dimerization/phospho-acceptor domain-containing protein [Chloroflexota bacterium]|nr:histidine kinase dimerization/phospho-acceptor domain-containing protein [Chloroflexota bacterium]
MSPETLDLLREVSHRLRSPLATVYGYASLLEAQADDGLVGPAELKEWARKIQDEAERMDALIADLSRLRLASSGELRLVLCDVRPMAAQADVTVVDGPPVTLLADHKMLGRALYHLLMRCGSAHIQLRDEPTAVVLDIQLAAPWREPAACDVWWQFTRAALAAHNGRLTRTSGGLSLELPRP